MVFYPYHLLSCAEMFAHGLRWRFIYHLSSAYSFSFSCSGHFFLLGCKDVTSGSSICVIFSLGTVVVYFWNYLFLTIFTPFYVVGIFMLWPYASFFDNSLDFITVMYFIMWLLCLSLFSVYCMFLITVLWITTNSSSLIGWNYCNHSRCTLDCIHQMNVLVGVDIEIFFHTQRRILELLGNRLKKIALWDPCSYVVPSFEIISSTSVFHHLHIYYHDKCSLLPDKKSAVRRHDLILMSELYGSYYNPSPTRISCSLYVNIIFLLLNSVIVGWTSFHIPCSPLKILFYLPPLLDLTHEVISSVLILII